VSEFCATPNPAALTTNNVHIKAATPLLISDRLMHNLLKFTRITADPLDYAREKQSSQSCLVVVVIRPGFVGIRPYAMLKPR
jgi:hypothetical protein